MKVEISDYNSSEEQTVDVSVENFDVCNLDVTLSHIIHPALVRLKAIKKSAPLVDNSDVLDLTLWMSDDELKKYYEFGDTDLNFYNRWDWVLDEMIWTFNRAKDGNYTSKDDGGFERMERGFKLFGKYYTALWE